jgi:hypothetical protein
VYAFLSTLIQEGTLTAFLAFEAYNGDFFNQSRRAILSQGLTNVEGTLCFTPFKVKCP